ncbi:MAG: 50S ribosomal protein L10 [Alphaproteobacteria bacterium CG11_big_fil_rev_8_21_14_0_20_44_7]|nr:MAG: 50S ribosomal protein L10 [Alphaproteobacteria bacterium CG11_big_fil_rev_8_21_14_0_20_44_7]
MDRVEKRQLVESLNGTLGEIETVVIVHNKGLTVAEFSDLRTQMREAGGRIQVAKNRLVKLALKSTRYESLSDLFKGPTAICYSTDPIAAAKIAVNFANDNDKLVILGGAMGDSIMDIEGVKQLAKMPSLDELRGKLVGLINAPATKLVQIVQAPAGQLARIFGAYAAKGN